MVTDRDIWHAATVFLRQYGDDAPIQAAQRAIELFNRGDAERAEVWKRILKALEELTRTERNKGEAVN